MKKIWYDITDTNSQTTSAGTARVEKKLREEFVKIISDDNYREFYIENDEFYEINRQGNTRKFSISDILQCPIKKNDVILSSGLSWSFPNDNGRIDEYCKLRELIGVSFVMVCHDLIPELIPQWTSPKIANIKRKKYIDFMIGEASLVFCVSKSTEFDLQNYSKNINNKKVNTFVIRWGDEVVLHAYEEPTSNIRHIIENNIILLVSTLERRKNHEVIYRAYHRLCKQGYHNVLPNAIFVGRPRWGVEPLLDEISRDPLVQGKIHSIGWVSDSDLYYLYQKALMCVYPSLYEGWGLPVAEALALGKVVLASNSSSIPEVGGDCSIYIDPWDVDGWAEEILKYSVSKELRAKREKIVRDYYRVNSWNSAAISLIEKINSIE